jgi:hypothetical protein
MVHVAPQDARSHRQEMLFLKACMGQVIHHQLLHGSRVHRGGLAACGGAHFRLQQLPLRFNAAVFLDQALRHRLHQVSLFAALRTAQDGGEKLFFLVRMVGKHAVLEQVQRPLRHHAGLRRRPQQLGQV